jgi:hypothetical protein
VFFSESVRGVVSGGNWSELVEFGYFQMFCWSLWSASVVQIYGIVYSAPRFSSQVCIGRARRVKSRKDMAEFFITSYHFSQSSYLDTNRSPQRNKRPDTRNETIPTRLLENLQRKMEEIIKGPRIKRNWLIPSRACLSAFRC